MESPIFIFSLPRSGSTLLQRILMSHAQIASISEPWIMLPFCYATKQNGLLSEYDQSLAKIGIEDFIDNLPHKKADYQESLRNFLLSLYAGQCRNNERYFLDKTPRYYNIIPEITEIFPQAKFIFLFRNPVHVFASIVSTWGDGRLNNLFRYKMDLQDGIALLARGFEMLDSRAVALQYEQLITTPEKSLKTICDYLDIAFDEKMLANFARQDTKGSLGDPTGTVDYKTISSASLNKWQKVFNNSFRKKMLIRYIANLSEADLKIHGYSKEELHSAADRLSVNWTIGLKDRVDILYSNMVRVVKPHIWFSKSVKNWGRDNFLS